MLHKSFQGSFHSFQFNRFGVYLIFIIPFSWCYYACVSNLFFVLSFKQIMFTIHKYVRYTRKTDSNMSTLIDEFNNNFVHLIECLLLSCGDARTGHMVRVFNGAKKTTWSGKDFVSRGSVVYHRWSIDMSWREKGVPINSYYHAQTYTGSAHRLLCNTGSFKRYLLVIRVIDVFPKQIIYHSWGGDNIMPK